MTTHPRPARLLAIALAGAALHAPAGASERVLVLSDGSTRTVDLLQLGGETISFQEDGLVRTLPRAELLGLAQSDRVPYRPFAQPGEDPRAASVELVTGERYPGVLLVGSEESLTLEHEVLGTLALPIDLVSLVRFGGFDGPVPAGEPGSDLVLLSNGDAASGFVLALDEALTVELLGQVRVLELAALSAVRLANPAEPPDGTIVWLDDGSIARVSSIEPGAGTRLALRSPLNASAGEDRGEVRLFDIGAVLFDAGRVRALAEQPASVSLPEGRRWSPPPEATSPHADPLLFVPDLMVPGPMVITWEAPEGARRVAMDVELPEGSRSWGDCQVALAFETRAGVAQGPRVRVHRGAPVQHLASDLPPGVRRITLTLEEGAFGPVQDRVVLRRPMLLMGP